MAAGVRPRPRLIRVASVSVIVNTYNRVDSLRMTLDALIHLDYPNFEVVVVNGPSDDGTDALLAEWAERIKVERCPNRNLSESRNVGIAAAAGELVAFIDDDAYPDPAWLDRLVEAFDDPEVAAVGGPVLDHTGAELQARYNLANRLGDARISFTVNPTDYMNAPYSEEFLYPIGTNSMFRRDLLVAIGGFDEEFEYYLDETDVACRLVSAGYVVRALDDGYVYHKFLPSAIRNPNRAIKNRFSVIKNKCYFAIKHGRRTRSFYEIFRNLTGFVEGSRADFRSNVDHGLLTEDDLEQFERDVHAAFDTALERFRQGGERTRSSNWFDESTASFRRFPTLRRPEHKLHLCFFSQEYPPGRINGIARVIHTLATGLGAEGHVVHVLTRGEGHDRVDLEDGVWVHRVVIRQHAPPESLHVPAHLWNYSASLLEELRRIHARRPVDVVEAPNWDSEIIAVLLHGGFTSVVGLYTPLAVVRTIDPKLVGSNPDIDRMVSVDRFCYEHADALRAAGTSVVETIEESHGIELPRDRIAFIPHGMVDDTAGIEPSRRGTGVNVLFVGRLEKRKGVDTLLGCIPELVREFPDVTFTIAGDDSIVSEHGAPYREVFERTHGADLPADAVVFTGVVDDWERQRLYAGCDIFVAPSRFESFGLVLVEAMMFGKPVIGGDNGGMRNIVEHGGNGYLVPPGDVEALRSSIASLIARSEQRATFGARSRELFEERFSVSRMVRDCNAFYDGLVGRRTSDPSVSPRRPDDRKLAVPVAATRLPEPESIVAALPRRDFDIVEKMRCPVCAGPVAAEVATVTEDGRLKTGQLWCDRCRAIAAGVDNFKFDFHAAGQPRMVLDAPRVVPMLGERRLGPDDPAVVVVGSWRRQDQFWLSDGRIGDVLSFTAPFTDCLVRLMRSPWSGIVDVFVDGDLAETADLFMDEGSQVYAVPVAADLPLASRTVSIRPRGMANPAALGAQVLLEEIVLLGPEAAGFPKPLPINRGNPFSEVIERYLDDAGDGDLILECGGGDRRRCRPNHLNFEYLRFELADVFGDIHSVPFRDGVFDLVFSQAVFEHVRNPFEAAEELIRVTRPGGIILTEVAFLQPLHAVPYHFFNMTLWGVEELFRTCEIVEADWFGELSTTVEWLLRSVNVHSKVSAERFDAIVREFRKLDALISHDDLKPAASGVFLVVRKR